MPTPLRTLIAFRTGVSSGGGGGTTGDFGYSIIVPASGVATIDIGLAGTGTCFMFRLGLNGTPVSIPAPIWTGGSIHAGIKIWLYLDQDATGNRDLPTFATGSAGDFTTDVQNQQIDGTPLTRTAYQLTYHGTRWCLDFPTVGTGMAIS